MSEYQYIVFRALDGPLNDAQLEFAHKQSSRAEVSRWSFSVEYNYSSFGGDVAGLLRGGYDVCLEYANYGVRVIRLRLPHGMPFTKAVWSNYVDGESLGWEPDAQGRGGILSLSPFFDSGELADVWEFDAPFDAAIAVRERLIRGDLRALYVLWLCAYGGGGELEETIEPPVPHGIAELEDQAGDLLEFFGLDPLMLIAAGNAVPPAPPVDLETELVEQWLKSLDAARAHETLRGLLLGDTLGEKARLLAEIRDARKSAGWPTTDKQRTFADLLRETEELRAVEVEREKQETEARDKRAAAKAERERADRMREMVKNPDKWLRESARLVAERGTANYEAASEILQDLREAFGGERGRELASNQARKFARENPTLTRLRGALKKRGLLD